MNDIEKLKEQKEKLDKKIQEFQERLPFVDVSTSGTPRCTYKNIKILLDNENIVIKHNEMSKETEIDIPTKKFHSDTEMNAKYAYLVDLCNTQGIPTKDLNGIITSFANENSYHPVRDYIDNVVWDNVDRLHDFYNTIETMTEDDKEMKELKHILMRKWALSGVAALYNHKDFSTEGVLTLTGAQAAGKTSWGFSLMPTEYSTQWVKDGVVLDFKQKDSLMKALGHWLAELGELDATFKKADIENLKGFITEKVDILRPPYERKANKYARRTFMYATVNGLEFLSDDENRRFWVLHVKNINQASFDVGQFWSQIKHIYMSIRDKITTVDDRIKNNEYGWFLSRDERMLLNRSQNVHKVIDPIAQKLEVRIRPKDKTNAYDVKRLNSTQILEQIGYINVTQWQAKKCGVWMREQGFEQFTTKKLYEVEIIELAEAENGELPDFKKKIGIARGNTSFNPLK
jgi:putative DNA primase/helicase